MTDVTGVKAGLATLTAASTWPSPHEVSVAEAVLSAELVAAEDELPAGFVGGGGEGEEADEA